MKPQEIDLKRQELANITEQLGELAKLDAKDISFEKAASLKERADKITEELQTEFKKILAK